jgi:ADP-heptose:LPS heptosyltransferase
MMAARGLLALVFYTAFIAGRVVGLLWRTRDTVLIIRTDGLGDALLFEPALENLGITLSPLKIHLWAPTLTCHLFAHCPTIARIVKIPRGYRDGNLAYFRSPLWRMKLGFEMGRCKFEKVIYPVESPEPLGNWLFANVRAVERWVNYGDTVNQYDWQRDKTHARASRVIENRPGNAHELHRNEYLVEQWSGEKGLRLPKVLASDETMANAEIEAERWRTAARKLGGTEFVGVVPVASMPIKSYPDAQWTEALQRLWQQQRVVGVLLGGPGDVEALDRLSNSLKAADVPFVRMQKPMGVLQIASAVRYFDGVLSVDTGLAHLAVAQRVPTVVLVTGGNPGRFFPWPTVKNHIVLNVATSCAGCHDRCTQPEPECITHITPDEIVAAYSKAKGRRIELQIYGVETKTYQATG